jgi:hypothetical protein
MIWFYRQHNEFSIGLEINTKYKWVALMFGFWTLEVDY